MGVKEEYNTKRASLGTVLVRAEHHTKSLTGNMAEMVSLRDDVQAAFGVQRGRFGDG